MKLRRICSIVFLATLADPCHSQLRDSRHVASRIQQLMETRSAEGGFNGTVLVARHGNVLYKGAFGFANLEWKIPNDLETKFEIGSITKQFTAMLVLQFVNEGKIRLAGHVSEYLSYYRRDTGNRVTIAELLDHTSGIPNFLSIPGFLTGPESRTTYTVQEFVTRFCSGDLQFEPGTRFEYSNSGYFLLGAILERVSGKDYEQLLQTHILQPLGMRESGYTHWQTILPRRASGYERTPRGYENARFYDMSIPFAAGAMYSTVGDLLLWDQALYTDRLLPERLRDLLFRPNLQDYGFGWAIFVPKPGAPYAGESIAMHGGAIFGFQSLIQRIPKYKELIVLLDNTDNPKLLEIARDVRAELAKDQ